MKLIVMLLAATVALGSVSPAFAGPPPPQPYWQGRGVPPAGHEFRPPPPRGQTWDRRVSPPPGWDRNEWSRRQTWLGKHGYDRNDHDSAAGLIVGTILGFVLGAAVADTESQREYVDSRLNDPAWIAYCARKYLSFDPYSGTYYGNDGLRHYCR
jgi:hypothetical protein